MKVDFIIVGAQKCATTSLFQILTRHPRVVGPAGKEPHFFSTSPDWRRELPRYEALFERREGALYCEASTSYTFFPHRNLAIWDDLWQYNPEMKLIYVVRDPVDRIVSHYMHSVARGYSNEPLERAVRHHGLYLNASRYYTQIIPYIRRFGREHVLILDFDDLKRDKRGTLETVTRFLDIDMAGLGDFEAVHANRSAGKVGQHWCFESTPFKAVRRVMPSVANRMAVALSPKPTPRPVVSPGFRRMIIQMLELEIRALEHLLGKDLSAWRRVDDEEFVPTGDASPPEKLALTRS